MRARSSLGMLLALAAGGGCTAIVGLDDVGFTGTGGSGATGEGGGGGATTSSSTMSAGGHGGGAGTTSSSSTGTTTTTPPGCGDNDTDYPEECDDGNTMDGDGCSPGCLVEPFYQCGEGGRCAKYEILCNDGLDNDDDNDIDGSDSDCTLPPSFSGCSTGQSLHVYKGLELPDPIDNGNSSPVFVADNPIIVRAAATLTATHPHVADLEADLTKLPDDKIDLFTYVGGQGADCVSTVLDSMCGTGIGLGIAPFTGCFAPEESFSQYAGMNGHGEWELELKDEVVGNSGTFESWALILCAQ